MIDVEIMDEARFEQLLEAYGADHARWPDAERARALRYLAATPDAHVRRADAKALDAMLDAWRIEAPSAALASRIAVAAPARARVRPRMLWLSGVGLAAACALGVLVGAHFGRSLPVASADSAVTAVLDGNSEFTPALDEASS